MLRSIAIWAAAGCLALAFGACAAGGGGSGAAANDDDASPADDDASPADDDDDNDVAACWTDLPVGEKEILVNGLAGSEGIAFSAGGDLFVTDRHGIAAVQPDGQWSHILDITYPVGIAFAPDGDLYICDFGSSVLPSPNDGAIYKMHPDFSKELVATGIANPNFLAFTPRGAFLVSDNETSNIYELTLDGQLTTWLAGLPTPDGMVFSADRRTLYVASTFPLNSPVYRVAVDEQGAAQSFDVLTRLDPVAWPDGAGLDENRMVYITENRLGKIARIDPGTGDYEIVASGMTTPASIAWGKGPHYDPCSIYVTELYGSHVWRVSLGVRGYPLPSEE